MKASGIRALFGCSLLAGLAACTSAPPPARTEALSPPAPAVAALVDPQQEASERFLRGKAFALAGDGDCARIEFDEALGYFRTHANQEDPEQLAFGEQLYDSIALYRALTEGRGSDERPPVEDPQDSLIAAAPPSTPQEVETVKREVAEVLPPKPQPAGDDTSIVPGTPASATYDIPVVVNEQVLRAVAFYQFRSAKAFAGALQRSGRYLPMMRQLLKEQGLPQDLVYVAMIESAFKHQAHSRKAAHGFWQFIEETGKRYGLKKSRILDERSDPIKSTLAAAAYFRDLYEMFGDWHLAMAAYDSGEGKILRGLQRTGARDYWELSSGTFLHRETRDYVPFVMAAALIAKNPARFGFDVIPDPPIAYDVVTLPRPVDLAAVARATSTSLDEIRLLNSELKGRSTPPGDYPLRVPPGTGAKLQVASLPAAPEMEERRILVRKGDTPARVAARYKVSVAELCDWNDLTRNAKLKKGMALVIAVHGKPKLGRTADSLQASVAPAAPRPPAGEIRALPTPSAAVNSASDVVPAGSSSVVFATPSAVSSANAAPSVSRPLPARVDIPAEGFEDSREPTRSAKARSKVRYTVRKGDTLFSIAQAHGTSVDAIRKLNRLGRRELLQAGRQLTLAFAQ